MDRLILQPGAIPLDTDGGSIQRNTMIALGYLMQATFGTSTIVDGLACMPTIPASMTVDVGQGSIISLSTIDATAFGSLPVDNTDPLAKMGTNAIGSVPFTLTAPTTSGQSINYLIEASLQEADGSPVVLPYYNPSNPSMPYSGPANSGAAQNTVRAQKVQLQLKNGAAATTGTQTTPAVDAGWVGLYVIQVNFGQTTVTSASISKLLTAPFVPAKLGLGMVPGFSNLAVYGGSGTYIFTVPAGFTKIRVRLVGGGGGGGGGGPAFAEAGGAAGGYAEGVFAVVPGQNFTVTVPTGGTGGGNGGSGGTASFGGLLSATGGGGGAGAGASNAAGGAPGAGVGGSINLFGGHGNDGNSSSGVGAGGAGGASYFGGGGRSGAAGGLAGLAPGSGGGGCYGAAGFGGAGAPGLVIVEW